MAAAAILNLFESKIALLEMRRPRKPHPITKHEVDRMTGCGDMAFEIFQKLRRPPSWICSNWK